MKLSNRGNVDLIHAFPISSVCGISNVHDDRTRTNQGLLRNTRVLNIFRFTDFAYAKQLYFYARTIKESF